MATDIRDLRGNYIIALANKYGWTKGAELGVWYGKTFFKLLEELPGLRLIGVDNWDPNYPHFAHHKDQQANRAEVYENAAKFGDRAIIREMDMTAAAATVPDGSLDFVFIDGDHTCEGCKKDILAWSPKIKPDGWIIGHDYLWPGVNEAVKELIMPVNCPILATDETWARPVRIPQNATTVCCLKQGDKYGPEYVNKLFSMVLKNVHLMPYDFVCFTDNVAGIDPWIRTAPLPHRAPGWWGKMGLYRPSMDGIKTDRLLFLDLDVVIAGNLDELLALPGDFYLASDYPSSTFPAADIRMRFGNTSVIGLRVGSQAEIWKQYEMEGKPQAEGDQEWINGHFLHKFTRIPDSIVKSYRLHGLDNMGTPPPDCKVVMFHGEPKPHQCAGWVKEYWQ